MNGAQRRTALIAAAVFVIILLMVLITNAESTISDLKAANATIPDHLVWSWEWTSMVGWVSLTPIIWWGTGPLWSRRPRWPVVAMMALIASALASTWHILVMVALRHVYYAMTGEGPYRFFGVISDRIAYEYRKDLVTFVQFVAIALVVRWMIERQGDAPPSSQHDDFAPTARHLLVSDGSTRTSVPLDEIDCVAAAGNYVELTWRDRRLLHRATLTGIEAELSDRFVRIHRGAIVRLDAIRSVEVERSGDFTVALANGSIVRGSRRYRDALRRWSD